MTWTYVVTGANRGPGLEFTRQLAAGGAEVIATARHPDRAHELRPMNVRVEQLDVADGRSVSDFAKRLEGIPIDTVIYNAGIGSAGPGIED